MRRRLRGETLDGAQDRPARDQGHADPDGDDRDGGHLADRTIGRRLRRGAVFVKNVVAAGLARKCTIQISYAIGVAEPLSFYVDLHGTGEIDPAKLELALPEMIGGATPRSIREHLGLNKPIYARTAAYGHFGRQPDNEGGFSWEKTDLADALKGLA